ncbi:uncharacterized protein MELLADRAFT_114142 [Melampsora larici-populina 98AG31]|uniref:Uncharacterized protein n=1 Tax=Melampsora larici-populina (strain 98AG31 / pathotype 3-4-7) TaxID=747676 RepID=F4SCB5_MELLP|nr:uncharacterized protein MELLADRAFT_114142 [Melampsora larici-populina 98AG31]EGF97711.1 hypothetical protein MELLADRAFT_114142 [Melampsora larici-populina 98AG31]
MTPAQSLTVEVVDCIIAYLYDDAQRITIEPFNSANRAFLHHKSIKRLLSLRFVARSWATAIPPFVYHSLCLRTPWVNGYLMKMWQNCLRPCHIFNLRYLCLEQVMFVSPSNFGGFRGMLSDECQEQVDAYFDTIPDRVPQQIRKICFPELRVVRTSHINPGRHQPPWVCWQLFQTVEVLITDYYNTQAYWYTLFKELGKLRLEKGENFKHIIFITQVADIDEDLNLRAKFGAHQIECHFRRSMNYTETLLTWRLHYDSKEFVDNLNSGSERKIGGDGPRAILKPHSSPVVRLDVNIEELVEGSSEKSLSSEISQSPNLASSHSKSWVRTTRASLRHIVICSGKAGLSNLRDSIWLLDTEVKDLRSKHCLFQSKGLPYQGDDSFLEGLDWRWGQGTNLDVFTNRHSARLHLTIRISRLVLEHKISEFGLKNWATR